MGQKSKDPTNTRTKKKKAEAWKLPQNEAEAKEERSMQREAEFYAREAKRGRKNKKIRSFREDTDTGGGVKNKKRKKSSFEDNIADTSKSNVKKFRHVANKKQNEDRRLAKKKGKPGKKMSSFK